MRRRGLITRYYQHALGKLTNILVTEPEILTLLKLDMQAPSCHKTVQDLFPLHKI